MIDLPQQRSQLDGDSPHLNRIGMIARWQPVHRGHVPVLHALCRHAANVLIGIGSSNVHNFRCPFTFEETQTMLSLALAGFNHVTIIPVPDLNDGPRWRIMVRELFGQLDCFVTDNPYVASLLAPDYTLTHPASLISDNEKIAVDGSLVRREMARGDDWCQYVTPEIENYIKTTHLDERFRQEFGLQTLALETVIRRN